MSLRYCYDKCTVFKMFWGHNRYDKSTDTDTLLKFKQQTCMNRPTTDGTMTLAYQTKEKEKQDSASAGRNWFT